MPQSLREGWEDAATAGTYTPIPDGELDAMWEYSVKHGSGNGWTGDKAATMIRKLLRERKHLINELERVCNASI